MNAIYPPLVDIVNTTNGRLPKNPRLVENGPMKERPNYSAIGLRLEKLRVGFSDLPQKTWAEKHGFNPTQWNNWETGARRISVDAAERLCETYGITLDYIFRGRRDGLSENALKVL